MKLCISGVVLLVGSSSAWAQTKTTFSWPPMPTLHLDDTYSPFQRKSLVKPDGSLFYAFTRTTDKNILDDNLPYLPELRKPFESQMGRNAFQLLAPQNLKRTFLFVPLRNAEGGIPFSIFNMQRVKPGERKFSSEVSYVTRDQGCWFHSPLFSPNGKAVLIQEGYPPEDMDYGSGLFVWEQDSGRFRPMYNRTTRLNRFLWSPGSRFLSYTHGGQTYNGPLSHDPDPYELWCLDVPSRREHLVLKNPGFDWSWTYHGQILCSTTSHTKNSTSHRPYSHIYEVNATGGTPRKLFERGFSPCESPDGRWIAFYDWPNAWYEDDSTSHPQNADYNARLCLFDRRTHKRKWLGILGHKPGDPNTPQLQWSLDGRSLFILTGFSDASSPRIATVYRMDASSHALSVLATLNADDTYGTGRIQMRSVSADGTHLYIETITSVPGIPGHYNTRSTLYSINARTRVQTPIAQIFSIGGENPGWDFRDNVALNPTLIAAEKLENSFPHKTIPFNAKKATKPLTRTQIRQKSKNSRR